MSTTLSDRLRQIVGGAASGPVSPGVHALHDGSGPGAAPRGARVNAEQVSRVLGGRHADGPHGAVVIVERHYAAEQLHGRMRVGDIVAAFEDAGRALETLARAWPGRGARPYAAPLCFFDLETTGLAGGAGTHVFLVGCAVPEQGGLRVRQLLLPGLEHERALLSELAEWSSRAQTLVSFNGRSFDVPVIETRYLLHRLPCPLGDLPHCDILPAARRLWRDRPAIAGPPLDEESCRLSVLERHLGGCHRVGDVPGADIPSRYFRFLRDGDARPLAAVLEHNRLDLISLALVTARILRLLARGPRAASSPREALGLGKLWERAGERDEAEACYLQAAAWAARIGREADVRAEALARLARCRRRAGRAAEAADAWKELLAVPSCPAALRQEAREALAIHHEHRVRDLRAARAFVLEALAEGMGRRQAAAEHRLRRIDRKLRAAGLIAALDA